MNLKIISAGAGSGKTYRLTRELSELLTTGLRPEGVFATTFTKKAAAELQERVRVSLLKEGHIEQANALTNALIGTVHSLGVKLLQRFSFEAGVSPQVNIIAEEDGQQIFNQSIAMVLNPEVTDRMEELCYRLGLHKGDRYDWRREIRLIADTARANNFTSDDLIYSRDRSWDSFQEYLPPVANRSEQEWAEVLKTELERTINDLNDNADQTATTKRGIANLETLLNKLNSGQHLYWHEWAKIAKVTVGAKSRDAAAPLKDFAKSVETHSSFQEDIRTFIGMVFDLSAAAITEYNRYKHKRGLIDYTDMEALVNDLLDHPQVREALSSEIDLLLVDEFQDTSPIQLSIFWKLSKLVNQAIWVGDPKQSIYGFRGADPAIMRGIIEQTGGIRPDNIQGFSWRSREDLVHMANALFTKAFSDLPADQVALQPKRLKSADHPDMQTALMHWHFTTEEKKQTNKEWMGHCIGRALGELLASGLPVTDKHTGTTRPVRPGDVAILCRTNKDCLLLAEAMHQAGLNASVSRAGLVNTPEVLLVLACLKYVLNERDSLSVAEILRFSGVASLQEIIDDRISHITAVKAGDDPGYWGQSEPIIRALQELRPQVSDLSSAEILDLVIDRLHIRHIVSAWGQFEKRQDNIDALRKLAANYEAACNRLQSGASLGGFLLWLGELNRQKNDRQGAGDGADSIRILTYHRSKGLEWPVVICHDLENKLRDSVYGLQLIEHEPGKVDLSDILANRWMRYWVNPYQDQEKGMPLTDSISEKGGPRDAAKATALSEEARLLYVGLTRARDYLVFVSRHNKPLRWLNRCWNDGDEQGAALVPDAAESPWIWQDNPIPVNSRTFVMPQVFDPIPRPKNATPFFQRPAGRAAHPLLARDPERDQIKPVGLQFSEPVSFHLPILVDDKRAYRPLINAVRAFITADDPSYSMETRILTATGLMDRYGASHPDPNVLCAYATALTHHLLQTINPLSDQRMVPLRVRIDHQRFETTADRLLETATDVIFVRDLPLTETTAKLTEKAAGQSSWAMHAFEALRANFPDKSPRIVLHFVPLGRVVEIRTDGQ